jgi:LysR family hydrogen peroxide-inducible transcriptional activator
MPTLSQLEYIIAVDKFRHFGRASKACHVSQPSLSMQLMKAEEELGVVIFDRSKKPILPTERGLAVIEQARVVLREAERLKHISQQERGELRGDFRLGVIPTLAPYLIPLFLDAWANAYPKVKLKIDEMKTTDIVEHLYDDRIDAGLLVTPLHEPSLHERLLFHEPFYLYVSDQHPLYRRERIRDTDLDGSDIWLLEEGHCFRTQILKVCSLRSKHRVYRNIEFESGNLETLKQLVNHNQGYTLLPHFCVALIHDPQEKRRVKPFYPPTPTRAVSLVHRRSQLKEDIVTALEKSIRESLPESVSALPPKKIEVVDIR